ncbi:MAG: hypothetical protein ACM3QS_01100 [Bacteroidota bacterium]
MKRQVTMPIAAAPFTVEALRPFVSVALHHIALEESGGRTGSGIAQELASQFEGLFTDFDIGGDNKFKLSALEADRGLIEPVDQEDISLTGVWFKRVAAPAWLDARLGYAAVQDTTNHILLVAIRLPYLAVLGTHAGTAERLSECLEQGYFYGTQPLGFLTERIGEDDLEQAFIRGPTRYFALSGLHASVDTKPDAKSLSGLDLRKALDPFADQTFTFTSVVSILPSLDIKRTPRHVFRDRRGEEHAHYAFRVGVNPEERRVWTVQTENSGHLFEELCVLFDTLELRTKGSIPEPWGYNQPGFMFLRRAKLKDELKKARGPFDISLNLRPPPEPGSGIEISKEEQRCQELWRAYGRLEVIQTRPDEDGEEESGRGESPPGFRARLHYCEEPIAEYKVTPQDAGGGKIAVQIGEFCPLGSYDEFHPGVTCFDTIWRQDGAAVTIRYDSGHVIRDSRIFLLGWEDVVYDAWDWPFRPKRGGCEFYADLEKPSREGEAAQTSTIVEIPNRSKPQGWEASLGVNIRNPGGSLFEYVVAFAEDLFRPAEGHDWHLCCDDGAGEVADFIYFEPDADRLYLIHIKAANTRERNRKISVKAYEEVASQAAKNLRYLEIPNLFKLLKDGSNLPIAQACFHNTTAAPCGDRREILRALEGYNRRLLDKRVIVFQPHVRRRDWEATCKNWEKKATPTRANQINRFLQLRTLLADVDMTCRKLGVKFETWGEDDSENFPEFRQGA